MTPLLLNLQLFFEYMDIYQFTLNQHEMFCLKVHLCIVHSAVKPKTAKVVDRVLGCRPQVGILAKGARRLAPKQ